MRPIKGLQLILSVALVVSVWGCFLSLFVLYWYGFLDPLIRVIGIPPTLVETMLIEVPFVVTVAWLAWLFPELGNAFKTVVWFVVSLIGILFGFQREHNAWKFNIWTPLALLTIVAAATLFWLIEGGIAGLVVVTLLFTIAFAVYKAFHKKGVFNSRYSDEDVDRIADGLLKFRSHPIGMIAFGIKDLWGPFVIIALLPVLWLMLGAVAAVGGSVWGHSLRPILFTPYFWAGGLFSTLYWFIWYGVRGSKRGVFCSKYGMLVCVEPMHGWKGWLGEVRTGEVEVSKVATGETNYNAVGGVATEWNPGMVTGSKKDPVIVYYIRGRDIAMIADWQALRKSKAKS